MTFWLQVSCRVRSSKSSWCCIRFSCVGESRRPQESPRLMCGLRAHPIGWHRNSRILCGLSIAFGASTHRGKRTAPEPGIRASFRVHGPTTALAAIEFSVLHSAVVSLCLCFPDRSTITSSSAPAQSRYVTTRSENDSCQQEDAFCEGRGGQSWGGWRSGCSRPSTRSPHRQ